MADLTREKLAELRAEFAGVLKLTGKPDERLSVSLEEGLALLSMASRCVSVETVRKLAKAMNCADRGVGELDDAMLAFELGCAKDLEEAAEALAKEGRQGG